MASEAEARIHALLAARRPQQAATRPATAAASLGAGYKAPGSPSERTWGAAQRFARPPDRPSLTKRSD